MNLLSTLIPEKGEKMIELKRASCTVTRSRSATELQTSISPKKSVRWMRYATNNMYMMLQHHGTFIASTRYLVNFEESQ
jgi:hypothetical protein